MVAAQAYANALGFTPPRGWESAESRLQAIGLHPSDPNFLYAAASVRATRVKMQPRVLARYKHTPAAVALPASGAPLDRENFIDEIDRFIDIVSSARAGTGSEVLSGTDWDATTRALIAWIAGGGVWVPVECLAFLTVWLQENAEPAITRLGPAAWLAVSMHESWREAARQFLQLYETSWLADWTAARPEYRALARVAKNEYEDVPEYLCGDRK